MRPAIVVHHFGGSELCPPEYDVLQVCPWCGEWHSADDPICEAWPDIPDADQITEDDIDWADWLGALQEAS